MQTLSGGLGRRWRQTDATMDVESLGGISVSSSTERQAMREQLDAVRQTLNSLSSPAQPNASGVNAAPAGLENALSDIATKLANIEGLYTNLTSKLEKVDLRVEDSERHIKELQHFSASTIHETARLVDYVGGRATTNVRTSIQAGGELYSSSGAVSLRARNLAVSGVPTSPPPPGFSPQRGASGNLEGLQAHVTANIQQHAAQIHKLIAGLDFLEAHIIRQDQLVENLQKQILSVANDVSTSSSAVAECRSSPSELSLRVHDMSELLNKLRAHMYKVEKKTSNNDQLLALLTQRIQAVESIGQQQQQREAGESSSEQSVPGPSILELMMAQEELRGMVQDVCRDVLELQDQLQAKRAPIAATQERQAFTSDTEAAAGMTAEEGAEVRRQLSYLMAQVPSLLAENKELKEFAVRASKQIDGLSSELEDHKRQLQQQIPQTDPTESIAADAELRAAVTSLQEHVSSLEGRLQGVATRTDMEELTSALQALEGKAAPTYAVTELDSTLMVVQADVRGLQKQVEALLGGLSEQLQDTAAARAEMEALSAAVQALSEERSRAAEPPSPAAEDLAIKLNRITSASPEAALLAAEVAASAKADLEEQFGQLRHRLEAAVVAAETAEGAARSSAGSAAAAFEAAAQAGKVADTELQESVLAMVAGLEQEQSALKQQLVQLAAQVSEEQAAISSGLQQVQEQVSMAASAATEAAACAQAVQEQQIAANGRQEQESEQRLRAMQAELREQVASVMERIKERVEQAMQEMHIQLSAMSARLSGAVTTVQLEDALGELRTTVADSSERYELAAASLEELRSEIILLTGQQDVLQSRLQGVESVLGVDARSQRLGQTATSSSLQVTLEEDAHLQDGCEVGEPEQADGGALGGRTAGACELPGPSGFHRGLPAAGLAGAGGLLDLVAELQSRVGGLESGLEAVAVDMDKLRNLAQDVETSQDTIQQATAQVISDLQDLSASVDQRSASAAADILAMEAASAAIQQMVSEQANVTSELKARMEGVQLHLENEVVARVQETSAAVSSLSVRVARDYVSREQLGAIFKARDNMKRAVDELASVFSTGRLLRTVSSEEDAANTSEAEASGVRRSGSGALSPRLVSALEDLAGKQAELEQQVHLALYRTEGAVRQEQLTSMQQAMLTLETQFRRLGVSAPLAQQQASATAQSEATIKTEDLSDLRTRVTALEAALSVCAKPGAAATAADEGGVTRARLSGAPTPSPPGLQSGSTLRVCLTPEDPTDNSTPVRLRLLVANYDVAATPRLDVGALNLQDPAESSSDEEGGEPSLSSMLHAAQSGPNMDSGSAEGSPDTPSRAALAAANSKAEAELCDMRRVLQDVVQQAEALRSEAAAAAAERQCLAESFLELQERLDLQVNATASTAAMVATMVTDQPQDRLRLQLRVGPTEAEADLAALVSTVSTLLARVDAAEEALASAFVVRTPSSPTRMAAASSPGAAAMEAGSTAENGLAEAAQPGVSKNEGHETEDASSEEVLRPALGLMVPVMPREMERQLAVLQTEQQKLEAALAALAGRVDGLEAVDALEEVRAAASEAVLDSIPGMVSEQVAVLREEIAALVARQGEQLLEMASLTARDSVQAAAVQAVAEAAAARTSSEAEKVDDAHDASVREIVLAAAREAALDVCMVVAREVADEAAREVAASELKDVRGAVGSLTERINDVDTLRDQLEALAAQVRDSITASTAAAAETESATGQVPPSTPTAAAVASIFTPATTALVIPPARTPQRASPSAGGSRQAGTQPQPANSSQQAAFMARLVEVVKRQSSRLHAQYNDAEETGMALAQVDHTLEEAEARLADVRDVNSPVFAETLVTVLEQVAALRYIGSQTHPAVQQMVLEHENRLDKITEELKALSGGSPPHSARAAAAAAPPHPMLVGEIATVSQQVSRMEVDLARVTSQHAALDRAVKDMLAAAGSVRFGSSSVRGSLATSEPASSATGSRRGSAHEGEAFEDAAAAAASAVTLQAEPLEGGGAAAAAAVAEPLVAAGGLEVAGLATQLRLLEDTLEVQMSSLRQELMVEIGARVISGGSAMAAELGDLEKTVSKLHSAVTAIRNRLLAMQEYVDSTQGMIKDMHVALGGLVRRVDALEAGSGPVSRSASGCGSVGVPGSELASIRELQSDLVKFERRLLTVESGALEAAHALAGLKGLAPRVTESESRLQDACSKLAVALGGSASNTAAAIPSVAPSMSLPAVVGAVRALERRLGGRIEAASIALDTLAGALSAAGRIQAESTANPFKAISAAVNNPVMVAMEKKLETVRTEILSAAASLSEDMRRDQQQYQLESRLASADPSVSGGSVCGSGGGASVSFRL